MKNVREQEGCVARQSELYENNKENWNISSMKFSAIIKKLFPNTQRRRRRKQKKNPEREWVYIGLNLYKECDAVALPFKSVIDVIPRDYLIQSNTDDHLTIGIQSDIKVNKNNIMKYVTFKNNNTWNLTIMDTVVNLAKLAIQEQYMCTEEEVLSVINLVKRLNLCMGVDYEEEPANMTKMVFSDTNHNEFVRYKCGTCCQVIPIDARGETCYKCYKLYGRTDEEIDLGDDDQEDLAKILENVFPNASPEMKVLLEQQHKVLTSKGKKYVRWNSKIISICLTLWLTSPKNYSTLKDSNLLILPSGRQLSRYKNRIPQASGRQFCFA